jgi:hypothetical protein
MDREFLVRPGGWYYVWQAINTAVMLAVLGVLIGILVCVCNASSDVDKIKDALKLITELAPCLANEFCPPIA